MIMNAGFGIFSQISSLNDLDELRVLVSLYARVSREWHYNAAILIPQEYRISSPVQIHVVRQTGTVFY